MSHHHSQNDVGWGYQVGLPPPPSRVGPDISGLHPENTVMSPLPGSGVPGWGIKSVQHLGSLCTPPCAGYSCDTGGV